MAIRMITSFINDLCKKNYRFKHSCNDDNDIGRRKLQKLDYRIFKCEFPVSSLQCHDLQIIKPYHISYNKTRNLQVKRSIHPQYYANEVCNACAGLLASFIAVVREL